MTADLEAELARVKAQLDEAGHDERRLLDEERGVGDELAESDAKVRALRSQMDQLTQEIKQANLQSLSIAPVDDLKIHLEGIAFLYCLLNRWPAFQGHRVLT